MKLRVAALLLTLTTILLIAAAPPPAPRSWEEWRTASRDDLKAGFDQVARNMGAVEDAYYSFTLEYRRVPYSIAELQRTGHLTADLRSPYTGETPHFPERESINELVRTGGAMAGDIWFRPEVGEGELGLAGLYLDPNNTSDVRWMRRDIIAYVNEANRLAVFPPLATDEERRMRVAMEHLTTAVEGYQLVNGTVPPTWADLRSGDTLLDAANPWSPGEVIDEGIGPGLFLYKPLNDDDYELVGFGENGPVYYYCNDQTHWQVSAEMDTGVLNLLIIPEENLQAKVDESALGLHASPNAVINKYILMDYLASKIDSEVIRTWAETHTDCAECGSTQVYWDLDEGEIEVCRDTLTGYALADCCCEALLVDEIGTAPEPAQ